MAQDKEVQGDVIQIPQEFVLLKEEYILKLSKRLISLSMVRKHPGADYIEILDDHIDSIVGIKNKIKEVDEMIESIKQQQQPTGVDND
tara:strand:- start:2815 stop:3078 length:264 start_codon:yes stop_codon:yes gene_type:complete